MEAQKISTNKISITKTFKPVQKQYTYEVLLSQRAGIIKQKETYDAQRDAEIAEIDAILAECEKLGITELKQN